MSWGTELWDQWEQVATHTQKGISFLETYSHFIRDRCHVEMEYARSLRRLVKSYCPKKKEDEELQYTYYKCFRETLNETGDFAGQHELIAENLQASVILELQNIIKELKDDRKKYLSEGGRHQQQLQQSLQQLEKAKKNYEKAFRESEKAQDNYRKADADLHLSRVEVEKQRMNSSIKSRQCEEHKKEYANQLHKTNQLQSSHYTTLMPSTFQSLQSLDEKRIIFFKSLLTKSVEVERSVLPIVNQCFDGVLKAAEGINETKDSELVIEKYKSGFTPPGDIAFDDLSTPHPQNGESTPNCHPPTRSDTIKGTMSASKLKKRVGLFGIFGSNKSTFSLSEKDDFSDLPPNQRKKKIQQKIEEVTGKLNQETAARDGMQKMKEVYEGNPSLGNPQSIEGQLSDSRQAIEKLHSELERYHSMLEDVDSDSRTPLMAGGGSNTPTSNAMGRHHTATVTSSGGSKISGGNLALNGNSPRSSLASQRTSLSDESLSRSSHSPESGIGLSHNSLPGSDYDQPDNANIVSATLAQPEEYIDSEPLPPIGTCHALYNFTGTSEGSMPMQEGESLLLIENDQGDGWTRVRRKDAPCEEGFVPTTYITIEIDNNC